MAQSRRFCPNCGSDWVEPDTSNRAEQFFSGGNPNRWQCNECGYTGMMPHQSQSETACPEQQPEGMLRPTGDPEQIEKESETEDEIDFEPEEEYSREYTGFGPAYVRYLLYVTLPVLAFYYLYLRLG